MAQRQDRNEAPLKPNANNTIVVQASDQIVTDLNTFEAAEDSHGFRRLFSSVHRIRLVSPREKSPEECAYLC